MKQDDLTQVKHIGVSRMKLFNSLGINTIQQLHEMPLEELEKIKSIGLHYARLIKNSVAECYVEDKTKLPEEAVSSTDKKFEEINQSLQQQIKKLNKTLVRLDEDLKPLWEKKYLELYLDFKKRSNKLKAHFETILQNVEGLPKKIKKNIINETKSLNLTMKKVGKKPKKKKYKKIVQEIKSFSNIIRDIKS